MAAGAQSPRRLGDCVEGAEALQVESVVHRVRHGEYGERSDIDHTQQPLAVTAATVSGTARQIERTDVTNEVFVVRRKQCDPGVSRHREASVKARWC